MHPRIVLLSLSFWSRPYLLTITVQRAFGTGYHCRNVFLCVDVCRVPSSMSPSTMFSIAVPTVRAHAMAVPQTHGKHRSRGPRRLMKRELCQCVSHITRRKANPKCYEIIDWARRALSDSRPLMRQMGCRLVGAFHISIGKGEMGNFEAVERDTSASTEPNH